MVANTPQPQSWPLLIYQNFTALNKKSGPLAEDLAFSQALYIGRSGSVIHNLGLLMVHPERNKRHYFEFA